MDPRIGDEQPWGAGCGYAPYGTPCNKQPVVRHVLTNEKNVDHYPTLLVCENHISEVPSDLIKMWHPIGPFCQMQGVWWDFELNECTVHLQTLEKELLGEEKFADDLIKEMEKLDRDQSNNSGISRS